MYDSGAWKPLLLFPILFVCVIAERGIVPLIQMVSGVPLWLFVILAIFCIILFLKPTKTRDYRSPRATMIDVDIIEITGDVESVQEHFHNLTSPANWVHIGDRKWRVEMPNLYQTDQTKHIVETINEWYGRNE